MGTSVGANRLAKRTYQAMTPSPNRRWFRFGEPWGLLAKANAKATPSSIVKRAILYGITYPWIYAALIYFRQEATAGWPLKITLCVAAFMALGALAEWQRDLWPDS
jgi:hypothetical protein